jgi:protein-S-isoprenylcysteine O-methyltransferase Ste14
MELMPTLRFGLLNGWLALALLSLTDGVLFLVFPREVVTRLFDRSGWSRKQVVFTVIGKLCALICIFLLIFTPLKIGTAMFAVGAVVVALGLVGLVKALLDFRHTPLGQPVERGIYRISRHPQIVTSSVVILGGCLAVGSWLAVILLLAARMLSHFGILGEEEVCLKQYGDSYRAYMDRVPRYFVFF